MRKYIATSAMGAGLVLGMMGATPSASADLGDDEAHAVPTTIASPSLRTHRAYFLPCWGDDSCLILAYDRCKQGTQGHPVDFAGGILCTNSN